MLEIVDFGSAHIEDAAALALGNYRAQRRALPILPEDATPYALDYFVEAEMGVVALDGARLVGYLAGVAPFPGLFGPVLGTFAPLHAHGTIEAQRERIYSRLYQAAANRWLASGATSHAVVLYALDHSAVQSFFQNGFGMRTVDAIRPMAPLALAPGDALDGILLCELEADEFGDVLPLHNALSVHMGESPSFMPVHTYNPEDLAASFARRNSRVFAARDQGGIFAYMETTADGENFASVAPAMRNICGAYMLPQYRGRGVYDALLNHLIGVFADEGCTHLGVDFESFNPTARGFWLRHFTAYTRGLTRRIDERIL